MKGRPVRGTTSHSSFFKNPIILGLLLKKIFFHLKDGLIQLGCMNSLEKMTQTSKQSTEFKEVIYKRF